MRICHIISGDQWAGAEVMNYRLLKGLQNFKDLEMSAILLNEGKVAEELRKLRVPVRVVEETRLDFFQIVQGVRNVIAETFPDIIHSHRLKENILAHFSAKSDNRIKLICTLHGMPEPIKKKIKILKRIILSKYHIGILSKYFQRIVAVSENIRNSFIREYGFQGDKVIMIHNGTDIPNHHRSNMERKDFVIGSAGRLFPVKDYPLMVEIARDVLLQANNIRFELAGEGPEKEKILGLIHEYKIEKAFTLTGFIDNMATFYEGLDLYINTSVHEGLPMSILEAMAHGLPIIAPNTGGIKEILENGCQGYLLDGRIPKVFADKCIELYNHRNILLKMGLSSREKVKKEFSIDNMSAKYYDLYLKIYRS